MGNREEYQELITQLTTKAALIESYLPGLGEADTQGILKQTIGLIQEEVAQLKEKLDRGLAMRIVEVDEDKDALVEMYRRIAALFEFLGIEIQLRTLATTTNINDKMTIASLSPTGTALYNSKLKSTSARRACTDGTRVDVLEGLRKFVEGDGKVYWMYGIAGTGKTTISYSLCEILAAEGYLGANFFCSRLSSECRDVNNIVPTIAYQLAQYSGRFRSELLKVLERDPLAKDRNIEQQFRELVEKPYKAVPLSDWTHIPVIIIDALDECEATDTTGSGGDGQSMRAFISALLDVAQSVPIKIFVTSRPERIIEDNMSFTTFSPSILRLHDIEKETVKADIISYLNEAFKTLKEERRPSPDQIQKLAELAGGLFIYAATVVRYMSIGVKSIDSLSRLRKVLANASPAATQDLDKLYRSVLAGAYDELDDDELDALRLTLRTVLCAKEPMTVHMIASMLRFQDDEDVRRPLRRLGSVLHFQEPNGLVAPFHASFPDFLFDQRRSGDFHCDKRAHSKVLAGGCFGIMKSQLRFNICNLESSSVFDEDVPRLQEKVKASISATLSYASRFWGDHLAESEPSNDLKSPLVDFLSAQHLFWMEVLNLEGCISIGVGELRRVHQWLEEVENYGDTVKQLDDVEAFIARFAAGACKRSTPHIYVSLLSFYHRHNFVYRNYWGRMRGLIHAQGRVFETLQSNEVAVWRLKSKVNSIAYSPDGRHVVCGFDNGDIRILDARSGNTAVEMVGVHQEAITAITFSSDGQHVASGSQDTTVRIWEPTSGKMLVEFKHAFPVTSILFCPNGSEVAVGLLDGAVWMWQMHGGPTVCRALVGHGAKVTCIAFSPDADRMITGSADGVVRLWDVRGGSPIGPVLKHDKGMLAIAFFQSGSRIIAICEQNAICVWDASNGELVMQDQRKGYVRLAMLSGDGTRYADDAISVWDTLTGSKIAGPSDVGFVDALAFPPDGRHILFASSDNTIRVWDIHSNQPLPSASPPSIFSVRFFPDRRRIVQGGGAGDIQVWDTLSREMNPGQFKGHEATVICVAVSPDGRLVASGDVENIIRLWDAESGESCCEPFAGHSKSVLSIDFSPDGLQIVSGSEDATARVWDVESRKEVAKLEGHKSDIWSVAYAPNGQWIATGSVDQSLRIWNVNNYRSVVGLLQGHTKQVSSVAFSPDSGRVVSASSDRTIRVWDTLSGNLVAGPFEHTSKLFVVAFSPDGKHIVSGSFDGTVSVSDASSGTPLTVFQGHTDVVMSLDFSPDGQWLISCAGDGMSRVWNFAKAFPSSLFQSLPDDAPKKFPDGAQISIQEDGWVYADEKPFFWCPRAFLTYLPHPRLNTFILTLSDGTISVDYHDLAFGTNWTDCNASL